MTVVSSDSFKWQNVVGLLVYQSLPGLRLDLFSKTFLMMIHNIQIERNILEHIYHRQVILEHLFIRNCSIYGLIRVHNRDFNKQIQVKLTIDQWQTSILIETYYFSHYSDNNTDSFAFEYTLSNNSLVEQISFAICYRVNNEEFWDNNFNRNYTIFVNKKSEDNESNARDYQAVRNYSRQAGNLCGLKNLQGTCYMNSILQTLYLTYSLREILLSKKIFQSILTVELTNLFELISSNKYELLTPIPIKQILGSIKIDYRNDRQQDAHEFLVYLLDYLQIDELFQGTYQSITQCQICSNTSQQNEHFTCLSLPIPFDNQCTLDDCWRCFQAEEYLTEEESRWFCSKCQCYRSIKKQFQIVKLPKILIIHFKRFQLDYQMNWIKNHTKIYYPEDNFNLSYALYSVVNHDGSLSDGHYTTFSRDLTKNSDLWFEFDDEKIEYLPIEKLHSNAKAYILFYVNKST